MWLLLHALKRDTPPKPRKLGVTAGMLRWAVQHLDVGSPGEMVGLRKVQRPKDRVVLKAALLFGCFFLCRASEYVKGGRLDRAKAVRGVGLALRYPPSDDLPAVPVGHGGTAAGRLPARVDVQFRETKTDQQAFGCVRTHYRIDGDGRDLCVVQALHGMAAAFPERFGVRRDANEPVFRWANGEMVLREDLQKVLERAALAVGLPPQRSRSHSLRVGGASVLLHATKQFDLVKRFDWWSSGAVHVYLHDSAEQYAGLAGAMACDESAVHYT